MHPYSYDGTPYSYDGAGVYFGGAEGALWGLFAGSVVTGCLGLVVAIGFLRRLEREML